MLGRRYGPRIFQRSQARLFSQAHAERAERFFAKHGPKAVMLARFLPVVRTFAFAPVVAGVAQMPRRRFTFYNVVGAVAWTTGILTIGFYLGGIALIAAHVELFAIGMVAVSLVPALAGLASHRLPRPMLAVETR